MISRFALQTLGRIAFRFLQNVFLLVAAGAGILALLYLAVLAWLPLFLIVLAVCLYMWCSGLWEDVKLHGGLDDYLRQMGVDWGVYADVEGPNFVYLALDCGGTSSNHYLRIRPIAVDSHTVTNCGCDQEPEEPKHTTDQDVVSLDIHESFDTIHMIFGPRWRYSRSRNTYQLFFSLRCYRNPVDSSKCVRYFVENKEWTASDEMRVLLAAERCFTFVERYKMRRDRTQTQREVGFRRLESRLNN